MDNLNLGCGAPRQNHVTNKCCVTNRVTKREATFAGGLCVDCIKDGAPHTGQSSQLLFDHYNRGAQFLPAVARSALNLPSRPRREHRRVSI